jgi:toxin ParE1/3/4
MTGRYVLSPRAQTDLGDIWDYTADRWGLDQAETYTRDQKSNASLIAWPQDMRWTIL